MSTVFAWMKPARLKAFFRRRFALRKRSEVEPALRSELFNAEQMERHGRVLAGLHRSGEKSAKHSLLARLADNETVLTDTCKMLTETTRAHGRITPAGEWLLDNFYLIEEQIRTAQRDFPKGYSRQLPRLLNGPSEGLPRVYDIALETISHGDGRVDAESLSRFVASYQTVTVLKLGELWAVPIMLRLALIENLRRVAVRVMADWNDRILASQWAETMTGIAESDPKNIILAVADMARSNPPIGSSFVAELARRLQGQSAALALPLTWIEQRLSESGQSIEHLVQMEAQQQAAAQVSISNSIGSLRLLSAIDWRDFVEATSIVDQTLREDPTGIYAHMDFATRDHYRHVIEGLAKSSEYSEVKVARAAIELAAADKKRNADETRTSHVGYYLIGNGLTQLARQVQARHSAIGYLRRPVAKVPLTTYLGPILLLSVVLAQPFISAAALEGFPIWFLILISLPIVLVTSQFSLGLVNWVATLLNAAQVLPRMDYSAGIPGHARTLVVIPTLISNVQRIDDLVDALEVRYLANRDAHLHFALLTDFADAESEKLEHDDLILRSAQQRIEALNEKYAGESADRFFLLHRPRRFNERDRIWMGYERKRGKLAELNALLRGMGQDRFSLIVGNTHVLANIKYVITLDTDTQLPRDCAREFIGAMAHPLNQAIYDKNKRRVVAGYGILQPRIGISLPSSARSRYANLFGSDAGVDPYTRVVSDVYQDLFQEGSFIGKGIYDVDIFEQAMEDRFPENCILSHDLIEGCYAHSGLLSDVPLYEEYPAHYATDVSRRHRWIRGDWQLLPWLMFKVRTQRGKREKNDLSALSLWKIFDNLRRSLVPPALLVSLLVGWVAMSRVFSFTCAILITVLTPPLLSSLLDILHKSRDAVLDQHLIIAVRSSARHFLRSLLLLAWLPHEAFYSLDAITKTLWRMLVTGRNLLQWNPSSEIERNSSNTVFALLRLMWIGPVAALGIMTYLLSARPLALIAAAPFLLLWFVSPIIAWWVSKPPAHATVNLTPEQTQFLRTQARKTWAFFDTHVTLQDNWLPPDNIQEQPELTIAHRTSPTNMGLALLANLAAYDFGYISLTRLIERTTNTLRSMQGLERHRGHFFNWYDTQSLRPLSPQYISTVDSGNLAAHLLTLRAGLLALPDDPLVAPRVFDGLNDTLRILNEAIHASGMATADVSDLQLELNRTRETLSSALDSAVSCVKRLLAFAESIATGSEMQSGSEIEFWSKTLIAQCHDIYDELTQFASSQITDIPTLNGLKHIHAEHWPAALQTTVAANRSRAEKRIAAIEQLARQAGDLAVMEYEFLYDAKRHLLAIGYNVQERRLDTGFYDLLASEARLTSFLGIAQGLLPQEGWFTLGRPLTTTQGEPVLLSWSGSMFEYLMPLLVMPNYEGTLLDQTCNAAVARQIEYGHQRGVAWGVSESGYNTVDVHLNYQYRAFGVPGLGLKRGLAEDLVIAPYACALALMVAPEHACLNLQRLAGEGLAGRFGLYEAVDYTPARLPRGQSSVVLRSFMAHHQGMTLLSLVYALCDKPMQKRFESDPQFQATTLLLQERVPKTAVEYLHSSEFPGLNISSRLAETKLRIFTDPDIPRLAVQLLSNGRYHVVVSSAGGGYSRYKDMAITRWREDSTCDHWGAFCYLRDVTSGEYWSGAYQPTLKHTELYEAIFSDARAEFRVRERDFEAHTEIVVSPEDDIELRRIRIVNRARSRRTIELTTYAEVVLAPVMADATHPAFSKLFVQTEILPSLQAILCTRRPQSNTDPVPWMCHLMAVHDASVDEISYETDRSRFIGRGNSTANPAALSGNAKTNSRLSNSQGSVLDPIVAIRCRITLNPEQSATVDVVSGIGESRDVCLRMIEKYRDRHLADRVFDLAWTHSQVLLRQLNASQSEAQLYERVAASILYMHASLRSEQNILAKNSRGQSGLWGQAISGDLPIVLVQISTPANIELVRQMVQAHAYWRMKGLAIDLVIWNEDQVGYRQNLQDSIMGLIASGVEASLIDRPGGIFVRQAQQIVSEDRILMQAAARVVLSDQRGTLAEQLNRRLIDTQFQRFVATKPRRPESTTQLSASLIPSISEKIFEQRILRNRFGGFSADGSEYVISLKAGQTTPAPWANVIANAEFGTVISESGGAYTFAENAHEFRLTPWHNDPITDASGEAIYLRDEETGHFWSPTPLPCRGAGDYFIRHGFGYSVFEHTQDGIHSELMVYVALDATIKFSRLKLRNHSDRPRRISVTGYVEWVLGDLRSKSAMHVVSEVDATSGALSARNSYNTEFGGRVAFFDTDEAARSITADRTEFIGRNGTLRSPAALTRARLSGKVGAGLDPCAAIQTMLTLNAGEEREIIFRLGVAKDAKMAAKLAQKYRGPQIARDALDTVHAYWRETLGAVQVETPDAAVNVLANGWLMYQTIACRFWARSGYYQSGGAFGFRDQLQDTMAMVHAAPQYTRQHLLLSAAHQFSEGDAQHWWHPPTDRGVRTRCSDDYLWLPLATSRYVLATGDHGVLNETVSFIEGRALNSDEESYYDLPARSEKHATLYQHCALAIEHSMARGIHGLPLIGGGDWNDGMNRVGQHGKGESVWLGFFLHYVLTQFAPIARLNNDVAFAMRCEEQAAQLRTNIQEHGWDGAWYRRAYFDDGTPLGSINNDECQIDSIAQSWSVLSGAADDWRKRLAMQSLDKHLGPRGDRIIRLLEPPFDHSALDPGYIKAYVPGVRENGGQYTHAAIWAIMAFAELDDAKRAWELLNLINPINHAQSDQDVDTYKIEPYVIAADVYAVAPHVGRGGWSWYTGSAGWMYRLIVESLLGVRLEGERLYLKPVLPSDWRSFQLRYRYRKTLYRISVLQMDNPDETNAILVDGSIRSEPFIPLIDDGQEHAVEIRFPRK